MCAVFGVACCVITLLFSNGWTKLLALVWFVIVPLWLFQWWRYRQSRVLARPRVGRNGTTGQARRRPGTAAPGPGRRHQNTQNTPLMLPARVLARLSR